MFSCTGYNLAVFQSDYGKLLPLSAEIALSTNWGIITHVCVHVSTEGSIINALRRLQPTCNSVVVRGLSVCISSNTHLPSIPGEYFRRGEGEVLGWGGEGRRRDSMIGIEADRVGWIVS